MKKKKKFVFAQVIQEGRDEGAQHWKEVRNENKGKREVGDQV